MKVAAALRDMAGQNQSSVRGDIGVSARRSDLFSAFRHLVRPVEIADSEELQHLVFQGIDLQPETPGTIESLRCST